MAESVKPRGNQLCSGTFGKLWIDGSLAYEVYKFEAKEKTNRESVSFAGDTTNDSKLMGVDYEFSYTVRKVYSRGKEIADGHKKVKIQDIHWWQDLKTPITAVMKQFNLIIVGIMMCHL